MNTTALYCNEYLTLAQSCILSILNVHKICGNVLYGCPDISRDTTNSSEVANVYADLWHFSGCQGKIRVSTAGRRKRVPQLAVIVA